MNSEHKILNGHSGCFLCIRQIAPDQWIVEKTSKDKAYNERLKRQMEKQQSFHAVCRGIYASQVYNSYQKSNDLFTFEMQMIDGQTVARYILSTDIPATNLLLDRLISGFDINYQYDKNSNTLFFEKIKELKLSIPNKNGVYRRAFDKLNEFEWNWIHKSACHGDLTLENIIINHDGELYLIDFLDSFYDSWMIDASKILQDLELGWSYRLENPNANRDIRLNLIKEKFIIKLLQLRDGKELLLSIYHILLLNILRIHPYAEDDITIRFIDTSVEVILNRINEFNKEL